MPARAQRSLLLDDAEPVRLLILAMPGALQGLASPTLSGTAAGGVLDGLNVFSSTSGSSSTGLSGLFNLVSGANGSAFGQFLNAGIWNDIFSSGFYMPGNWMGTMSDFMNMGGQSASQAAGAAEGAAASAADGAAGAAAGPLSGLGAVGNSVSASLGQKALVGPLSVPPSWAVPAPLHSPLASTLGGHTNDRPSGGSTGYARNADGQLWLARLRACYSPVRVSSYLRGAPPRRWVGRCEPACGVGFRAAAAARLMGLGGCASRCRSCWAATVVTSGRA